MRGTEALTSLFLGNRVCQTDNRQTQYALNTGHPGGVALDRDLARLSGLNEGTRVVQQPYIMQITGAQGGITISPYTFTVEDLAADNWTVAESTVAAGGQARSA